MEQEVIVSEVGRLSKAVIVKSREFERSSSGQVFSWTFFFLKCYSILSVQKKKKYIFYKLLIVLE